jgi:hypothetical protein
MVWAALAVALAQPHKTLRWMRTESSRPFTDRQAALAATYRQGTERLAMICRRRRAAAVPELAGVGYQQDASKWPT